VNLEGCRPSLFADNTVPSLPSLCLILRKPSKLDRRMEPLTEDDLLLTCRKEAAASCYVLSAVGHFARTQTPTFDSRPGGSGPRKLTQGPGPFDKCRCKKEVNKSCCIGNRKPVIGCISPSKLVSWYEFRQMDRPFLQPLFRVPAVRSLDFKFSKIP